MQKHNPIIDILRFFASFIVVLFHLNQAIPFVDNWYRNLVKYGWLGVPIFFVISGYCIIASAYNSENAGDFLSRRIFRIFPPYWISLLVVMLAAIFQKMYIGTNAVHYIPRNVTGVLATLTLTTSPLSAINTINWVYWTLTCEILFYTTIFLVLLFKKKLAVYFLIIISLIAALSSIKESGPLFFLDQWPAFGLGICIFYFFRSDDKLSWICFGALLLVNLYSLYSKFHINHINYIVTALITFALVLWSHYIKSPQNLFSYLGQHSYSVYLIHVPVGVFILGVFEKPFIEQNSFANAIYDLIVYSIIGIVAWGIFELVEKPSMEFGKKMTKKYFKTSYKSS